MRKMFLNAVCLGEDTEGSEGGGGEGELKFRFIFSVHNVDHGTHGLKNGKGLVFENIYCKCRMHVLIANIGRDMVDIFVPI